MRCLLNFYFYSCIVQLCKNVQVSRVQIKQTSLIDSCSVALLVSMLVDFYYVFRFSTNITGQFILPIVCMMEPKPAHLIRCVDHIFIDRLKKEILENPTNHVAPMIGLLRAQKDEVDAS